MEKAYDFSCDRRTSVADVMNVGQLGFCSSLSSIQDSALLEEK